LSKGMSGAGNETAVTSQALKFLGLSAKDAAGNLKDPSVLFGELSKKLINYEDGAGKAAIAQALFGKAGAEILPTLKKMAELGAVDAAVTTDQAVAAEAYGVEVAKLNRQKEILWNTLVSALLPTMQTFVGVLLDASKNVDSLGGSVKRLAADKSIENWADAGAMGVARLVDVMKTSASLLSEISAPFERYFKASQAGIAAISIMAGPGTSAQKDQALTLLREEAERENIKLQARMSKSGFLSANVDTSFSDSVQAAIKLRKANAEDTARDLEGSSGGAKLKKLNFEPVDAAKAAAEQKLYEGALQRLEMELGNVNNQTAEQKIVYELLYGSLQKVSFAIDAEGKSHAGNLLAKARELDIDKARLVVANLGIEAMKQEYAVETDLAKQQREITQAGEAYIEDLQFQIGLIGKNTLAQQQLSEAHKIDIKLTADLLALREKVLTGEQYEAQKAFLVSQAEAQKAIAVASVSSRVELERSWAVGAKGALNDYTDNVASAANQSRMLFTNAFKGMEDALVNFVKTGKMDFKSLADSIITDLIRIQIQNSITKPLAKAMESDGGLIGALGKLLGSGPSPADQFAAGVIPMAAGGDFMVNKPTLFLAGEAGPERATFSGGNNTGGSGSTINIYPDLRGASVEAVDALHSMVRSLNASVEPRAANVLRQARVRGG